MERKQILPRKESGGGNPPETFAITVEGYDLKATPPVAYGNRLDNGELVKVSLRDIKYKQRGRFVRSEIADFASPRKDRNHPGTVPGGILLVQEAFRNRDGTFAARWIQSLSHTPGEAEVFQATIHVGPVKYGKVKSDQYPNGKPYSSMTMLHDGDFTHLSDEVYNLLGITKPFQVDSSAQLEEAVTHLIGEKIGVGVRVSNDSGFDSMRVAGRRDADPAEVVANFMKELEPVKAQIDSGEIKCEVVPFGNIWAGPSTVDIMLDNSVVQSRLKQFNAIDSDSGGRTVSNSMFRTAIVAVRATGPQDDRGVFFTHFEPLWTRQPVSGLVNAIAYAKTDVLAPVPPKPEPAAQAPSAAPARSDDDSGSFDADDSDLMAAAGATVPSDIGDDVPEQVPAVEQPKPAAAAPRNGRYGGRRMANG